MGFRPKDLRTEEKQVTYLPDAMKLSLAGHQVMHFVAKL